MGDGGVKNFTVTFANNAGKLTYDTVAKNEAEAIKNILNKYLVTNFNSVKAIMRG
jgi:hypothetical protein